MSTTSSSVTTSSIVAAAELLVRDVQGEYRPASADEVLRAARRVLSSRVRRGSPMNSPDVVKDYLRLQMGTLEYEVFAVMYLDVQHRLIAFKEMFRGTVSQTSVYPREVVREALQLNAMVVNLAHNHPSGAAEPSRADEFLTHTLKSALSLIDVRVIDHLVVTADTITSFAEIGRL